MSNLKVMLVEDDAEFLEAYYSTVKVYQLQKNKTIDTIEANTKESALDELDNTFDGAIIDLKLAGNADDGNIVIEEIHKKYRIPVAVMTARPGDLRAENPIIKAYKKGEHGYDEILDDLFSIFNTGITNIMGGRGKIETAMDRIFWKNILPKFDAWKAHRANGEDTEGALLRFVIAHLYEVIDNDIANYFPEETYIHPPISDGLMTGSIVKQNDSSDYFIVLSPACDLVLHKGQIKTDRILLCAVEGDIIKEAVKNLISTDKEKKNKATATLDKIPRNSYCYYYHYLPKVDYFEGGIVNFRKVSTYKPEEIAAKFGKPELQVAAPFIKDIISRFSVYYARQGQPDFDFDKLTASLTAAGQ
jgi:CheY-like chemotaxis protein